jgi:hypothetical protein
MFFGEGYIITFMKEICLDSSENAKGGKFQNL